jgi:hypothetical protein
MITLCRNCAGYFTPLEMATRRPPMHPWQLTPGGLRASRENEASGDQRQCPVCGCRTLR